MVLENALGLQFSRIRFLKGGLAAWKAKGYPVEAYTKSFHLDTASLMATARVAESAKAAAGAKAPLENVSSTARLKPCP